MALFKRKTIISVASVIYPLGEEPDKVSDLVVDAMITASVQRTNIAAGIKRSIINGEGVKMAQGYNYARGNYYLGMPTAVPSTMLTKNDPTLELLCEEYLRNLFTPNVIDVVSTAATNSDDYDTVVKGLIFTEYHYDFYEDKVFTASGSIQVNASLDLTGPIEDVGHLGQVGYHLVFTNPDTSTVTIDKWYTGSLFTAAAEVKVRIVMEYTSNAGPHQTYSYSFGGSDPRLNIFLRDLEHPVSGTFPAIVLKKNNIYLDTDAFTGSDWKNGAAYQTSRSYARRMDIDVDGMLARIKENASDGDIDYAFIQPGTLINATNQAPAKYHFNYFNRLRLAMPDTKPAFDAWMTANNFATNGGVQGSRNQAENMPAQSIHLYDTDDTDKTFNMEMAWRYISYEVKSGTITEPYVVECGAEEIVQAKWQSSTTTTEEFDTSKLYFRKRLTDSTYAEICVCGAWHENYVYKGHSVQSSAYRAFNDPEGDYGTGFLIPLDYNVFLTLNARERLQLSQEAFHMVFNCYVAKKQKWYQTGIFKVVLFIIAAVIIYFTAGTTIAWVSALYTSILTVVGVAAIAIILTALVVVTVMVGIQLLAKETGEWAAEKWGPEWGAVVQIAATIALSYGVSFIPGVPSFAPVGVVNQVAMASSYILMGMAAYTQYQYANLNDQQQAWMDYVNQPNDPLEAINAKLEEMFPDLTVAQQALLPNPENLDEFLGRTLTTTEGLTGRLLLPITDLVELTLTPRLI